MAFQHILVGREGDVVTITMNRPDKRNALSVDHMTELLAAFTEAGVSDATGIILAANGPAFSAGHDFAEMAGSDLEYMRVLLQTCTRLMQAMHAVPQPVLAKVHALATAAGCQLVATADLAVAADGAAFAIPGGKGGWFCHTPLVAVARSMGRKRALEMAMSGDTIDAATAADWGLINRAVAPEALDAEAAALLARVTRGSRHSKGAGKHGFYQQIDLSEQQAYAFAVELMAATSQTPDAQEGMAAFLEKRPPKFEA